MFNKEREMGITERINCKKKKKKLNQEKKKRERTLGRNRVRKKDMRVPKEGSWEAKIGKWIVIKL